MNQKPKNRRVVLTRGSRSRSEPAPQDTSYEIPTGAKREIRRLIEEESFGSTTEIAKSLNRDGYPCAQADKWSAKLVDSALRRQDMNDLKEKLRENRDEDLGPPSIDAAALQQAAYNGAKDAVADLALKMPDIPPLKVDTFTVKGAVADAVNTALKGYTPPRSSFDVSGLNTEIFKAVTNALEGSKLPYVARLSEATSRNVGEVCKRIDDACGELDTGMTESLKEHSEKIHDTVEALVHEIYTRIDARFDKLEDAVIAKLCTVNEDSGTDGIKSILGQIVDARLKTHMDTVVNQFAVMLEGLKKELRVEPGKRGRR